MDGARGSADDGPTVLGSVLDDTTFRVRLCGDLARCGTPELAAVAEAYRLTGCRHVVVDLTPLTFLNARGLTFIALLESDCRARGGTATLLNPGHDVVQLLAVAGLAGRFRIVTRPVCGDRSVPAQRRCHPLER